MRKSAASSSSPAGSAAIATMHRSMGHLPRRQRATLAPSRAFPRLCPARRGRRFVYDMLDPARTALVVINLQRAFMDEGAPSEVPQARAIVPHVNRLASGVREAGGTVAWVQATFGAK